MYTAGWRNVLLARDAYYEQPYKETEITVSFGEYANPSFESQVETISKAKSGGIMSVEASVDELYGDTKDETWKSEEVTRLKAEQGITEMEEPQVAQMPEVETLTGNGLYEVWQEYQKISIQRMMWSVHFGQ